MPTKMSSFIMYVICVLIACDTEEILQAVNIPFPLGYNNVSCLCHL